MRTTVRRLSRSSHELRLPPSPSPSPPLALPRELYMRALPSATCLDWNSAAGRELFREALAAGSLECYFPLAAQFTTQAEPAYCGLGSLAMVLNALRIDPGRVWKGPWRWYSEAMLACCVPLPEVASSGISLDAFASLARCNGAAATLVRCSSLPGDGLGSLASFRAAVRAACATPSGSFLVASYSRAALGQTGGGHFSPLAGYHEASDSVLVLDVARFKYPPHWVSLSTLHAAMLVHDPSTGRPRGWVMTARSAALPLVLLAFGNAAHTGFWPRPYESGGSGVGGDGVGISPRQVCHRGSACCQVEALSVDAPPSSSGGCCQLKGRSVVGAQELLRTAAATLESSECERSVGEVGGGGYGVSTTAAALQLALDILLRGGGWHTGHQAAAAAARSGSSHAHEHVGTLLSAAAKAVPSSSSSAIADWGEYRTADDDADDAAATAAAASARCWTRLSREQVLSASELLTDVARTPLHAHITALLDGGNSPAVGSSGRSSSGIESGGSGGGSGIESGNAVNGIAPPSLFSGVALFAAARGSDPHDTSGSGVGANTSGGHIHGAACGHEVDTCVRVSTADVLTLLLLTLYGGDGNNSSVPSSATIPAALILRSLAAASLGTASPLLRAEVALLKGQLLA